MATITYIVQAINRASSVFNDVADSAAKLAAAEDAATVATLNYNRATALQIGAVNRTTSALKDLRTAALGVAAAQTAAGASTAASGAAAAAAATRWRGFFGLFGGTTQLFGGVGPGFLSSIGNLHLAIDLIAEFLAVALPATIALVGFGAVAGPIFADISTKLQQINTVSQALGKNIYPITGQFLQLQRAIKPQTFQLFGEGLNLISQNSQKLIRPLQETGNVLDQIAARAEVALGSGGFGFFLRNAVKDLQEFGDIFGNILGSLGNVFRNFPGIANIALGAIDNLTKGLEALTSTRIAQWGANAFLWAHGAAIYIGLLATGIAKIVPWLLGGLSTGLAKGAGLLGSLGSLGAKAGVQLAGFSIVAQRAAALPWGWIAVAAAGLGFLIYRAVTAKTAFENLIDSINTKLAGTGAAGAVKNITGAISELNVELAKYGTLGKLGGVPFVAPVAGTVGPSTTGGYAGLGSPGAGAIVQGIGYAQQYNAELTKLQDQLKTYKQRIQELVPVYGSFDAAQRAVDASGVSLGDFTSKNANTWARAQAQIMATTSAYEALGMSQVEASNDVQVLGRASSDQVQAVTQLNQAWSQYVATLTGGQAAFDTWALAFGFASSGTAGTSTFVAGTGLIGAMQAAGATIDGLNTQSLQLNQAFTQQVQNSSELINSWRSAGIVGDTLSTGIKAIVAQLLPFAGNSQEALAQLTGLLDEAGYQGPPTLKNLNDFLGQTGNSMKTVQSTTEQATIQMGLLTTAMQGQGQYIANQLLSLINQAVGAYDGVDKAATNYGNAIAQYGKGSAEAQVAQDQLTYSIVKAGLATGSTNDQIAALISQVLQIPQSTALQIVLQDEQAQSGLDVLQGKLNVLSQGATVPIYVSLPTGINYSNIPNINFAGLGAAGTYVSQGTTSTADNVVAMVSKGELIVPAHMVASGMVDHLRGSIPGFAYGGMPLRAGSGAGGYGIRPPASAVTARDPAEVLLASIDESLKELQKLTRAGNQIAAAGTASGGNGRAAAYQAIYSPRG